MNKLIIRSLALVLFVALTGCVEEDFNIVGSHTAVAHHVELGRDIQAIPGQEIIVYAYLSLSPEEVKASALFVSDNIEVEHFPLEAFVPDVDTGVKHLPFQSRQKMRFYLPVDAPTGVSIEMVYTARDILGVSYRDTATLGVIAQDDAGRKENYTWDLQVTAENKQWDNPPVVSPFDVAGMNALMDAYYPASFPEDELPHPMVLQPLATGVVGTNDIGVDCKIPIGSGYCVVFEDTLHEDSDKDYDLWFAAQAEKTHLVLEAKGISVMGAHNLSELLITDVGETYSRIRVQRAHRPFQSEDDYEQVSAEIIHVVNGAVTLRLWDSQHDTLRHNENRTEWREWKFTVTLLQDAVIAGM